MNDNPYAPPKTVVAAPELAATATKYYVVSPGKLMTLFIATLGMYSIYWFYKNWQSVKQATKQNIVPVMRGLFSIFFTHSLFRSIHTDIQARGESRDWSPNFLATSYVILSVAGNIVDRMAINGIGVPLTDVLGWLFLPLTGWVLMTAQRAANQACGDPQGTGNHRLTGANWVWIGLGVLIWGATIYGLFASE